MLARCERDEALQRCPMQLFPQHLPNTSCSCDTLVATGIAQRWTRGDVCLRGCSSYRATSGSFAGCDRPSRRIRHAASGNGDCRLCRDGKANEMLQRWCCVTHDGAQVNAAGRRSVFEFDKVRLWCRRVEQGSGNKGCALPGTWSSVAGAARVQVRAAAAGQRPRRAKCLHLRIRTDGQVRHHD